MKNLALKAYHKIPIFEFELFLYVSRNAVKTYNHVAKAWGLEPEDKFKALAITDNDGAFAVFFDLDHLNEESVGHEVDHLVNDYMMPYIGQPRCKLCNNEPHAYVVGYVLKWVKQQLKRAGLRVR